MCGSHGVVRSLHRSRAFAGYSSLVLSLLLLLPSASAVAESANIRDGLAVVAPDGSRHATVGSTQPVTLWIKGDRLYGPTTSPEHDGVRAIQFGVEVDPRLLVINRTFVDPNTLDFEVAPDEWILGMDCVGLHDGSPSIMAYTVLLNPQHAGATDLRVQITDLAAYGEPLAWTTCAGGQIRRALFNAGGVLLNPSPGAIALLTAEPRVAVAGRDYRVAWETVDADEVYLNGQLVSGAGGMNVVATETTDYILTTVTGGVQKTEQITVEVLREPRVKYFTAERVLTHDKYRVSLRWQVEGTDVVSIEGHAGNFTPIANASLPDKSPSNWILHASNEWGSVAAFASPDPYEEAPPIILQFSTPDPNWLPTAPVPLSWTIMGATSARIEPDIGPIDPNSSGMEANITGNVDLELIATNEFGESRRTLPLRLRDVTINDFRMQNVPYGGMPLTLSWDTEAAENLSIDPFVGPVSGATGSVTITSPAGYSHVTLTGTNSVSSAERTLSFAPSRPLLALVGPTDPVRPGVPFQFEIRTLDGALSASVDNGIGDITPEAQFIDAVITEETTFTVTANNTTGTTTRSIVIGLDGHGTEPPTVGLSVSDATPVPGVPQTLNYVIQNAQSASLAPNLGLDEIVPPISGSVEIAPTEETTYVLTATNPNGTSTIDLTVTPGPPAQIVSFGANPAIVRSGDSSYLSWEVTGAFTAVEILGIGAQPAQGQLVVQPVATTDYTLRVTTAVGLVEETTTVTVDDALAPDLVLAWSDSDPNGLAPVVAPFEPFTLWALAVGAEGGLTGADFRLELPACVTLLGQSLPSGGINVGQAPDAIIGFGQCLDATIVPVVEYSLMVTEAGGCAADAEFSLAASSIGGDVAERADCGNQVVPFRLGPPVRLYGNSGEPVMLELVLDGQATPDGVELRWTLPGAIMPSNLSLHRRSTAGEIRLDAWGDGNKDVAKQGSYLDAGAPEGEPLEYWLEATYGETVIVSEHMKVEREISYIPPREPIFFGATPNPFNPRTEIRFELDRARHVQLTIYDLSGRRIWSHSQRYPAGPQSVPWTGVDRAGRNVASGSYFAQLEYEGGSKTSRLTLVR